MTISATGYKPTAVSVVISNGDKVAHTVAFKQTTGFHCTGAPPFPLPAGQSASCTFTTATRYNFSDPAHKRNAYPRHHTVGKSSTAAALTVTPKVDGGKFKYPATPLKQTAYAAKSKSATSPGAIVKVQPRLSLRKVSTHHSVSVSAAQSFAGKSATFQRYRSATKRWVKVARDSGGQHDRRRPDGNHVGEVPLTDQGEAAGTRYARVDASRPLLRRVSQQHDPQLALPSTSAPRRAANSRLSPPIVELAEAQTESAEHRGGVGERFVVGSGG